jgi:hypothetical protein
MKKKLWNQKVILQKHADMADISVVSEEVSDRLTKESSETRDFLEHF